MAEYLKKNLINLFIYTIIKIYETSHYLVLTIISLVKFREVNAVSFPAISWPWDS